MPRGSIKKENNRSRHHRQEKDRMIEITNSRQSLPRPKCNSKQSSKPSPSTIHLPLRIRLFLPKVRPSRVYNKILQQVARRGASRVEPTTRPTAEATKRSRIMKAASFNSKPGTIIWRYKRICHRSKSKSSQPEPVSKHLQALEADRFPPTTETC